MDTWVASTFWLLQIMLLWTGVQVSLWDSVFNFQFFWEYSSKWNCWIIWKFWVFFFFFLRKHQTVFHSGSGCNTFHSYKQCFSFFISSPTLVIFGDFWLPGGASGKEPACQSRRLKSPGFNPWVGSPPRVGNGYPLQYSCLENPMDRGVWWTTVHGVAKSQTWLKWLSMHTYLEVGLPWWVV